MPGFLALGGFLRAIPAKAWLALAAVALVLIVWWRVTAALDRAHAETRAAHLNAAHAVLYGAGRQAQVFADVASIAALRGAITAQNAAVQRMEAEGRQASQEAAEGLRRAQATHAADEARIAALSRPVAGNTPCERAENRRAQILEALR